MGTVINYADPDYPQCPECGSFVEPDEDAYIAKDAACCGEPCEVCFGTTHCIQEC